MSNFDAHTSCTVKCIVKYTVPLIIAFYVLKIFGVFRFFQLKIQKMLMETMAPQSNRLPAVINAKTSLFESLKNFKSPRILEVGAGDCRNLEYYPDGSSLVIVEPNEQFHPALKNRVMKVGAHVKLEAIHSEYAERLNHVEEESIDAYVMTHVTCSIQDMDAALSEAQRVLKPGGKLYIFHHFLGPNAKLRSPRALIERWFIFPIVGRIMDCQCDRYIEADLRRYFPESEITILELPFKFITLRYHLLAVCTRS